jgi:hypothetical protein
MAPNSLKVPNLDDPSAGFKECVIEQAAVRGMVYRGSSGCHVIVQFHKPA